MDRMGKRKIPEKKKIIMFINSMAGKRCGAIFEVYIELYRSYTYSSINKSRQASYYVKSDYPDGDNTIYPIKTFFDQRPQKPITSVAACLLGSKLYMVPDDEPDIVYCEDSDEEEPNTDEEVPYEEEDTDEEPYESLYNFTPLPLVSEKLTPLVFDLIDHSTESLPELNAKKSTPIMLAIPTANKVFSFTSYIHPNDSVPEPCFESLDLNNTNYNNNKLCWRELPCYQLHRRSTLTGYALLSEDFLLISLKTYDNVVVFRSYNIWSSTWKDVLLPHPTEQQPCFYDKEGVAVGNDIYTYQHFFLKLFVFSYTDLKSSASGKNYDLSLTSPCEVKGLTFEENDYFCHSSFFRWSAIAKIDEGLLCILHALFTERALSDASVLPVRVCIIQLQERDACITLKLFECKLYIGTELKIPVIKSCHVLNLKEASDHRGGKRAVRSNNADDKVLEMEMDCGST